jgi:hypothetical protein
MAGARGRHASRVGEQNEGVVIITGQTSGNAAVTSRPLEGARDAASWRL